jgi:hypothetical protein
MDAKPKWQQYHGIQIPFIRPEYYRAMQPFDFYLKLAVTLLQHRADGTITDQQDDEICWFMGEVWKGLSQQDRDRINLILIRQEHDDENTVQTQPG